MGVEGLPGVSEAGDALVPSVMEADDAAPSKHAEDDLVSVAVGHAGGIGAVAAHEVVVPALRGGHVG